MKRFGMEYFIAAAMCALIIFAMSSSAAAGIIYVKWNSPGSGDPPVYDGKSWDTAFHKVQDGINASISGDDIWVAGDKDHPYVIRIALKKGVGLYGGFAGTEISRAARNWKTNVTILDGDGGGMVVVSGDAATATTVIDGFTIRNGTTAGIYCTNSSPTISNNTIIGNGTLENNGGIYCLYASPVITNNTITGNTAYDGGGICSSYSSPTISNNTIRGNTAADGGGIHAEQSSTMVFNNTISGNRARRGGGIMCSGSAIIANNTITGNDSWYSGGGVQCQSGTPVISNNVVAFNSSGLFKVSGSPTLKNNCVFNPDGYNYSGLSPGAGDISFDPLFRNAADGDYHLLWNSPCVDAGTSDGAPFTDLDGNPRPIDGNMDGLAVTDMGAYEFLPFQVNALVVPHWIHLQPNAVILVVIPSTRTFNAGMIDPTSVLFGPGRAKEIHGKGHFIGKGWRMGPELLLHFRCGDTGIKDGDTSVPLCGRLTTGEPFTATAKIVVFGGRGRH
jgi:hypothetical protein